MTYTISIRLSWKRPRKKGLRIIFKTTWHLKLMSSDNKELLEITHRGHLYAGICALVYQGLNLVNVRHHAQLHKYYSRTFYSKRVIPVAFNLKSCVEFMEKGEKYVNIDNPLNLYSDHLANLILFNEL